MQLPHPQQYPRGADFPKGARGANLRLIRNEGEGPGETIPANSANVIPARDDLRALGALDLEHE